MSYGSLLVNNIKPYKGRLSKNMYIVVYFDTKIEIFDLRTSYKIIDYVHLSLLSHHVFSYILSFYFHREGGKGMCVLVYMCSGVRGKVKSICR